MHRPESAAALTARAALLAALAAACSTIAHVSMGGLAPSGPALTVNVALLTGLAMPVVRHARTRLRTLAMLTGLQAVAHTVHSVASASAGASLVTSSAPGHHHHGQALTMPHGAGSTLSLLGLLPSWPMVMAHLLAAILLTLVLGSGERAWISAAGLRRPMRLPLAVFAQTPGATVAIIHALVATGRDLTPPMAPPPPPAGIWHGRAPARRGPPVLLSI